MPAGFKLRGLSGPTYKGLLVIVAYADGAGFDLSRFGEVQSWMGHIEALPSCASSWTFVPHASGAAA